MQAQVIYAFPLVQDEEIYFNNSFLEWDGEDILGLLWVEHIYPQQLETRIQFFRVDLQRKNAFQRSIEWQSSVNDIQLRYDRESKRWITCLANALGFGTLALYGIEPQQEDWFTELVEVASEYHFVPLYPILFAKWRKHYHVLYFRGSIDEVSDLEVYWSTYQDGSFEKVKSTFLSYCDTATSFQLHDHYLLFSCHRVYDEEPSAQYPRVGPGRWQLSLQTYAMDSKQMSERSFIEEIVPIRDTKAPHWDLSGWLDIRICVIKGPKQILEERPTCVAVMIVYEAVELPRTEANDAFDPVMESPHHRAKYTEVGGQQHGGLFWFDYQGTCLQQSTSILGAQISMCCCGKRIIGTDRLLEHRRLWLWLPLETQEVQECLLLDSTIKRATVISQDEGNFWLIEEHTNGVNVSLRDSTTCGERSTTWLEGLTLPDGPSGRYFYDQRKPAGVISYDSTLLILGFNMQKQLTLFQISPDV